MEGEQMRRQADPARHILIDSPTDTNNADEQQPLTHTDDSTTRHHNTTDTIAAHRSKHTDTLPAHSSLVKRLRCTVPTVAVISIVFVFLILLAYTHYSTAPDEPTAPPHFPAVCLTSWEGQWGNIVYQLMFLLSYSHRHNLTAYVRPAKPKGSNPLWHGYGITYADVLYGGRPCPWRQAAVVVQVEYDKRADWADSMSVPPLAQRDGDATLTVHDSSAHSAADGSERLVVLHRGYYQFHTSGYRPYRDWLTQHMRPKAEIDSVLLSLWYTLLLQLPTDMLLIAVHVRHGDYTDTVGSEFRRIPLHWYYPWVDAWLHNDAGYLALSGTTPHEQIKRVLARQQAEQSRAREWLHFDDLIQPLYTPSLRPFCQPTNQSSSATATPPSSPSLCLLVISDDPQVATAFNNRGYLTVTPHHLTSHLSKHITPSADVVDWYVDWWLLTRVGVVATSHSSFSHTATLYNVWGDEGSYWRPDAVAMRLMQYEPWDSQYVHHVFKDVVFE